MTSRSRRGGESQKDNGKDNGRNSTRGAGSSGNSDRDNDGHSGSQGADTSVESEVSHPPARGIVSMLKVKKNRSKGIFVKVNWNELGQPIGKESITLAHYVGALARRTFPITVSDFRKKELAQSKEAFWDEIMATFTGLDGSHKKAIISRAGNYHRVFRTRLRNLARDANGNYSPKPPILYQELRTVTEYWNDFVKQALNEEFKATSKKNKESAKAMEARYKSACVGYARLREQIDPIECYLYQEPPRRYVGKGILHNGPNETCHGVRLEAGYVRVQFEVAVEEEKDTALPVPCDEARTVGGAAGYFLPWPKKLVSLEKPEIIVSFRGSTTTKRMGRPRKFKEIMIEELKHCSHHNSAGSDDSSPHEKLTRVTFDPEPQILTLEHVSNIAARLSDDSPNYDEDDSPNYDEDDSPNYDEDDSMLDAASVKVDEYTVKKETAPLLKSILAKQGDIAMNCVVETTTIRSSLLENVCGLYQKLERKDPKAVKVSEVKSMLAEVGDFEKVKLDVKWLRERLEDIAKTLEESEDYSVMQEEVDKNNQDAERKSKELEELEAKTRVARDELATIEARGIKLCERLSDTKAKRASFCEKRLVEGLL